MWIWPSRVRRGSSYFPGIHLELFSLSSKFISSTFSWRGKKAFCRNHNENTRTENHSIDVRIWTNGKFVQEQRASSNRSSQHGRYTTRLKRFPVIFFTYLYPAYQDFKIQNMLSSCDVKFPIRLEGLSLSHGAFCSYEPEIFPGLIYRMRQSKMVLLIFASGKIILTGAKVMCSKL
ncbi:hypothetical protein BHM03_00009571 [Ensete ventricosum]|nr:hypothetical protein BHM03_00009571 [Ensete ventricosum]